MAEVRKFKPGSSPIADAIAKAMGEPVRPNTPGEPTSFKPRTQAPRHDIFSTGTSGFTVPAPRTAPKPSED